MTTFGRVYAATTEAITLMDLSPADFWKALKEVSGATNEQYRRDVELVKDALRRKYETRCLGCYYEHPSQVQHMGFGGCMSSSNKNFRKIDVELICMDLDIAYSDELYRVVKKEYRYLAM